MTEILSLWSSFVIECQINLLWELILYECLCQCAWTPHVWSHPIIIHFIDTRNNMGFCITCKAWDAWRTLLTPASPLDHLASCAVVFPLSVSPLSSWLAALLISKRPASRCAAMGRIQSAWGNSARTSWRQRRAMPTWQIESCEKRKHGTQQELTVGNDDWAMPTWHKDIL